MVKKTTKFEQMNVDQLFELLENTSSQVNGTAQETRLEEETEVEAASTLSAKKKKRKHSERESDENITNISTETTDKSRQNHTSAMRGEPLTVDITLLTSLQRDIDEGKHLVYSLRTMVKIFRATSLIIHYTHSKDNLIKKDSRGNIVDGKKATNKDITGEDLQLTENGFICQNVHFMGLDIYENAVRLCLEFIPVANEKLLNLNNLQDFDQYVMKGADTLSEHKKHWNPSQHNRWNKIQLLIKSFLTFLIVLMKTVKDDQFKNYLLKTIRRSTPLLVCFPKLIRISIKTVIHIWSGAEEERTRGMAYFTLYSWALYDSANWLSPILKKMQNSYRNDIAKVGSLRNLFRVIFSANTIVDLFGIDLGISYSLIFIQLRELAVILKRAITSEGKEFRHLVENWQFVNQLRLYEMVLSSYAAKNQLRALIYPYVQIVLGVIHLASYPSCFGLNVYIPVASSLIRTLFCTELKRKPTSNEIGKGKQLMWRVTLRLSLNALNSRAFRDGVISQVVYLLAEHFSTLSRNVAFPELIIPSIISLKKFLTETKVGKYRRCIQELVEQMEANATCILRQRREMSLAPTCYQSETLQSPSLSFAPDDKTPMEKFFELEKQRMIKEDVLMTAKEVALDDEPWMASKQKNEDSHIKKGKQSFARHFASSDNQGDIVQDLILSNVSNDENGNCSIKEEQSQLETY
eukprot:jgi/Galph1/4385/GphlegSOOS_G3050.1